MSYIQYNAFDKVIIEVKPNYVNEEIYIYDRYYSKNVVEIEAMYAMNFIETSTIPNIYCGFELCGIFWRSCLSYRFTISKNNIYIEEDKSYFKKTTQYVYLSKEIMDKSWCFYYFERGDKDTDAAVLSGNEGSDIFEVVAVYKKREKRREEEKI
jgi:hypothetical protein